MIQKKSTRTDHKATKSEDVKKDTGYIEIPLPKLPRLLSSTSSPNIVTVILFLALIVGSFFLGHLWTKVQFLEKGGTTQNVAIAPSGTAPAPQAGLDPNKKYEVGVGHFPVKGDPNAKVTVVEFADFRCPFCEKFYTDSVTQMLKEYVDTGKVKFAFRSYAFLGPASTLAHNAAECANEQNKFWEFHNYLYENHPPESDTSMFTSEKLTESAGILGLDTATFKSCLDSNKFDENVQKDVAEGQSIGVDSTPTAFVNGKPIVGAQPYTAFKTAIEAALNE